MKRTIKTEYYGTGQYWFFDNGQYGEKTEIKQRDCFELLISNEGEVFGLCKFSENTTGGGRLNSHFIPIASLTGKNLEMFNLLNEKE